MDRNLDVLWEILLSLISRPSPKSLYNFLAANPTAFAIFCFHGVYPVTRRINQLENTLLTLIETVVTKSATAVDAAEASVIAAETALAAGGTDEEVAAAVKAAAEASVQASDARQMAADTRAAVAAVKPVLLGSGRPAGLVELEPLEGNSVVGEELRGVCGMLVQWRRLRHRLFEAAAEVAIRKPKLETPEHITEATAEIVKEIRKHGSERFGGMWKRRFFRLEKVRVRRSARIRAKATATATAGN